MAPRLTPFEELADVVKSMETEVSRRNPIGVNLYTPYLRVAADMLQEIHLGELGNPTCEAGPGVEE